MTFACLFRGDNLGVVQVDLVNSVVEFVSISLLNLRTLPIQLSEDVFSEFVVGDKIS